MVACEIERLVERWPTYDVYWHEAFALYNATAVSQITLIPPSLLLAASELLDTVHKAVSCCRDSSTIPIKSTRCGSIYAANDSFAACPRYPATHRLLSLTWWERLPYYLWVMREVLTVPSAMTRSIAQTSLIVHAVALPPRSGGSG